MILKSFEIENNINNVLKFKFVLLFGENIGLKEVLKKAIIKVNSGAEVVNLYQEDITKNKDIIINEVKNVSLFTEKKIIIINQIEERILQELENVLSGNENIKLVLIGGLLDKKSKLRAIFEKDKNLAAIPCYNDTEITLRKIILNELKEYKNLNTNIINMIMTYSNLNRKTILTNLEKIKSYFDKKMLTENSLEELLNSDRNEIFESIRDATLNKDKKKLNSLLGNFTFASEDTYMYLNMINFRLTKLLEIHRQNTINQNIEVTISKIKPPIFWKDKPLFIKMLKKWDKPTLIDAIKYLSGVEKKIKKNSTINSLTMVKNTITNLCSNSWAYF